MVIIIKILHPKSLDSYYNVSTQQTQYCCNNSEQTNLMTSSFHMFV